MNDKSFINTKKLTDSLLDDLNIKINNKENELLELKIKSNTAKKLLSLSKNKHHLKPDILYLSSKEHNVGLCNFCNSVMIIKRKTKKYCSDTCRVQSHNLRGNTNEQSS